MLIFALMGAAGYVAPRHMRAIKAIGGELRVAFDPRDSVGIIDSFFPDASFFVEFERFDRHIDKLRRVGEKIDYVTICSPNYLHDAHCRFALRSDADAICEKPLVLNTWNLDGLAEVEIGTGRRISSILQLRLHPAMQALKTRMDALPKREISVDLTYIASRGRWYQASWKGDEEKSGGVATNIGIHFFDALVHTFGPASLSVAHLRERNRAAGFFVCGRANIRWFLSVDRTDLPAAAAGRTTFRSILVEGDEIEFSDGFTDLHARSYEEIIAGRGFGLETVRPALELVSSFRTAPIQFHRGERHPMVEKYLSGIQLIARTSIPVHGRNAEDVAAGSAQLKRLQA